MRKMSSKDLTFIDGVTYAAQELVLCHDQPDLARGIVTNAGTLDKFLKAQKRTGFETRKMNKFFREAFKDD